MLADPRKPDRRQLKALLGHLLSLTWSGIKQPILDFCEANVVFLHSDRCSRFKRGFARRWNDPLEAFALGRVARDILCWPNGCG
jgi:hypothetical protein